MKSDACNLGTVTEALQRIGRPATASEIYEAGSFNGIQSLYVWLGNHVKKEDAAITRAKQEGEGKFVYAMRDWKNGGTKAIQTGPHVLAPAEEATAKPRQTLEDAGFLKPGRQEGAGGRCKPALKLGKPGVESHLLSALVGLKEERDLMDARREKLSKAIKVIEKMLEEVKPA